MCNGSLLVECQGTAWGAGQVQQKPHSGVRGRGGGSGLPVREDFLITKASYRAPVTGSAHAESAQPAGAGGFPQPHKRLLQGLPKTSAPLVLWMTPL